MRIVTYSSSSSSSSAFIRAARVRFAYSLSRAPVSSSFSRNSHSAPRNSPSLIGCRPIGFLSGSLRCSVPRWSHVVDWRSPVSLRVQIRTAAPVIERFERNFATMDSLPYSIRILLESAIRNCDNFQVTKIDVEKIIDWENTSPKQVEIPFKPARVPLQDFTGVPAVVDLASMRDAMNSLGSNPDKINPLVPVDLVIDHSVQVDVARKENVVQANMELEFRRNKERFGFLRWGSSAFRNMLVVPPGSGIVHQVNLEYLGRVVFNTDGVLYPDSVVGTDSHTTMIDGLGVAGWGVGGIEAEAALLGQVRVWANYH